MHLTLQTIFSCISLAFSFIPSSKERQVKELREKISKAEKDKVKDPNLETLKKSLGELEKNMEEVKEKEKEVQKEEQVRRRIYYRRRSK